MSRSFFRTYGFLSAMLLAIVLGCVLGALWPGATCLAPLGTIFINLMFCIVVPLVFCSLSINNAVLTKNSRSTFGKAIGTTSGWDNNTLFYSDGSNSGIMDQFTVAVGKKDIVFF